MLSGDVCLALPACRKRSGKGSRNKVKEADVPQRRQKTGWKKAGRVTTLRTAAAPLLAGCAAVLLPQAVAADERAPVARPETSVAADVCAGVREQTVQVTFDSSEALFVSAAGDRFLASDIEMPVQASGQAGGEDARRNTLQAYLESRPDLELAAVAAGPENRWGLTPGWVFVSDDGHSALLQEQLLKAGVAIFAPGHAGAECADALRAAETQASLARAGLWGETSPRLVYSAAAPKSFSDASGHYVIARGRIVSLGKTRSTRYLNFGKYWKTDFTVTLKASAEDDVNTALGRSGWTLDALEGQVVEIRGSVQERDGPSMVLRHPEQLVVLNDKRAGRDGQSSN